jgi:hypothetical protein
VLAGRGSAIFSEKRSRRFTRSLLLTREPEPPALVTSESDCFNIRDLESGRASEPRSFLTCQPEPPALVLNEPSCYHFRVLESRVFAILSATSDAVTIGHCSHI